MLKKLVFLGMGGTIAGLASTRNDNIGYQAAQIDIDDILVSVPSLSDVAAGYVSESEQVAQVDSKDMGMTQWGMLAERVQGHLARSDVRAVIVTHGTDTLEETAYFLSRVLDQDALRCKPVVLTCAMRPASSANSDGPQNLVDAVAVAVSGHASGVLAVCAGTVHTALHVQKIHPYRLDAFDSGEAGPIGFVEEGRVRWVHPCPVLAPPVPHVVVNQLPTAVWPRVEIVLSFAGASGAIVRALCGPPAAEDQAAKGIVVAGTGNGTIHADLLLAVQQARALGLAVVRTSRCAYGQVVAGHDDGNALPECWPLSPVKARIELALALLR